MRLTVFGFNNAFTTILERITYLPDRIKCFHKDRNLLVVIRSESWYNTNSILNVAFRQKNQVDLTLVSNDLESHDEGKARRNSEYRRNR